MSVARACRLIVATDVDPPKLPGGAAPPVSFSGMLPNESPRGASGWPAGQLAPSAPRGQSLRFNGLADAKVSGSLAGQVGLKIIGQ